MGLCNHEMQMLLAARASGASFEQTLTIGRQELYLHPSELARLRQLPRDTKGSAAFCQDYQLGEYVDRFCRQLLGAQSVAALDYSAHEGATLIHDLNQPIPLEWREQFDAVIDGGSLEHVFHFPNAVANVMTLAKVGGSIFLSVPANNHCGHGFYQFSPELMYRVFAPENGFHVQRVALVPAPFPSPELTVNRAVYEVADPAALGCRVGLMSRKAVTMLVWAQKTAAVKLFAQPPLQSDYQQRWQSTAAGQPPPPKSAWRKLVSRVFRSLPVLLQNQINGYLQRNRFSFGNRQYYRRR